MDFFGLIYRTKSTMRVLVAIPLPFLPSSNSTSNSTSSIAPRDIQDSGDNSINNNQVSVVGIVMGCIIGVALVAFILSYLFTYDNCITRGSLFRYCRKSLKNKNQSQYLTPPDDEESLKKRVSFASERESIMFSRSRASSLHFAVVENVDNSQRRAPSQVYILRGREYVLLEQTDAEKKSFLSRNTSETSEAANITSIDNDQNSDYSIPTVASPQLGYIQTNQHSRNISHTGSIDYSGVVPELSVGLAHTSR